MEQWHVPIVTLNKILQLNSNQVVGNPQKEQVFFEGKPEQEIYRNPLHCESSNLNGCAKQTSSTTLISFECDIVICSISVVVGGAIDGAGVTFNVNVFPKSVGTQQGPKTEFRFFNHQPPDESHSQSTLLGREKEENNFMLDVSAWGWGWVGGVL